MDPYAQYKSVAIKYVNKTQQVVLIFDEVIKKLYQAKKSAQENDVGEKYKSLRKAADIFDTVRTGIDVEDGNETMGYFDRFLFSASMEMERLNIEDDIIEDTQKLIDAVRGVRDTIVTAAEAEGII